MTDKNFPGATVPSQRPRSPRVPVEFALGVEGKTSSGEPFKVQAFKNGKFIEVTEQSLKGKWSAFIFMPAAFTFNCPTEVEDAADNYAEF